MYPSGNSHTTKMSALKLATTFALIALMLVDSAADPKVGFYTGKCKSVDVENTVFSVVNEKFKADPTIAPALIRMHFHDCFVSGCDASILLNTTSNSERNADPNKSVRGYDVIDEAKAKLEEACQGVVSCADIIAIAARDAVKLTGGGKYPVETGRRDCLQPADIVDLPSPSFSVAQSIAAFLKRRLDIEDMVLLLGAHSIGVTHCSHFQDRLDNQDGTMDESLRKDLRSECASQDATVNLNQNLPSSGTLDNSIYNQIIHRRGVLRSDQELTSNRRTNDTVNSLAANVDSFRVKFGQAMVKMGAFRALTGQEGEIRKLCFAPNSNSNSNSKTNDKKHRFRLFPFP